MAKDLSITTKVNGAVAQQLEMLANAKGVTVSELAAQMIEDQVSYQQTYATEKEPEKEPVQPVTEPQQPVTKPQSKLVVAITLIDGGHTLMTFPELDLPTRLRLVAAIDGVIDDMPRATVPDQAMMETMLGRAMPQMTFHVCDDTASSQTAMGLRKMLRDSLAVTGSSSVDEVMAAVQCMRWAGINAIPDSNASVDGNSMSMTFETDARGRKLLQEVYQQLYRAPATPDPYDQYRDAELERMRGVL